PGMGDLPMSEDSATTAGPPEISVVVPLYNEERTVRPLYDRLVAALRGAGVSFEIVFVDDGSRDATALLIDEIHDDDSSVVAVHLSRNFGHQPAVSAGLDHATGRGVVVMDGDLQDPPEL